MKCPFCGNIESRVIDSRPSDDYTEIRRRRLCETCGKRFTTYERTERFPLVVVKKDQTREPFNAQKLEAALMRACHKRPISMEQLHAVVEQVENELSAEGKQEVQSTAIGELVMKKLQAIDEVAYIRFASVYREFSDISSFTDEVRRLTNIEYE